MASHAGAVAALLLAVLSGVLCEDDKKTVTVFANGLSSGEVEVDLYRSEFNAGTLASQLVEQVNNHHLLSAVGEGVEDDNPDMELVTGDAVHDAEGTPIRSFDQIKDGSRVYLRPESSPWMWPVPEIGEKTDVKMMDGRVVTVEAISEEPRIFRLHNMFSAAEADQLILDGQNNADDSDPFNRSQTVTPGGYDKYRTSENSFVSNTQTASTLIVRAFDTLKIPYDEDIADGLQVVRYGPGQLYDEHFDWLDDATDTNDEDYGFNFDPATGGSNRFATILFYLQEPEVGGQTVFPFLDMPPYPYSEMLDLRPIPLSPAAKTMFKEKWQKKLLKTCHTKLAFTPRKGDALLFYNLRPDMRRDESALHAGCPVIRGTKWGASLWIWNNGEHTRTHEQDDSTESGDRKPQAQSESVKQESCPATGQ